MKPPIVATATIATMKPKLTPAFPPLLILVVLLVASSRDSKSDSNLRRRQAWHVDSKSEQIAGVRLRDALLSGQVLGSRRRVRGAQIVSTERDLGDVRDRKAHEVEQRALRRVAAHAPTAIERDPDAARAVDRRPVREPAAGLDARERARVAQRAVRGDVERDDRARERVDVIERAAVGRERGPVRDRARVDRGAADSPGVVEIDAPARRVIAVVYAAEPNSSRAIDRGIVQTVAGRF